MVCQIITNNYNFNIKANPTNHSYLTKQLHPKNTDYIKSLHHLMTVIPNNK